MPCFDKKLEASRSDFFNETTESRDVDVVITPVEIEQILEEANINFADIELSEVDCLFANGEPEWTIPPGSGSGGYAEHVYRFAAKELFGMEVDQVHFTSVKNSDMREAILQDTEGRTLLKIAIANGFRNIQNVVQRMKRKKCLYDYIEVMACPSGKSKSVPLTICLMVRSH